MNITAITTLYRLLRDDAPKNNPMEAFEEIISRMNDTGKHDQLLDEHLISMIHEYAQRRFNEGFVAGYDGAMTVFYSNKKSEAATRHGSGEDLHQGGRNGLVLIVARKGHYEKEP